MVVSSLGVFYCLTLIDPLVLLLKQFVNSCFSVHNAFGVLYCVCSVGCLLFYRFLGFCGGFYGCWAVCLVNTLGLIILFV